MSTLGARLALWYSLVSTITLFVLLAGGYYLLNRHLVRGVDLQNTSEFERLSSSGPPIHGHESPGFFVEVVDARGHLLYRSAGLPGDLLPPETKNFTLTVDASDSLRIGVFPRDDYTTRVAVSLAPVQQVMLGYAEISIVLICLVLLISLISGMLLSRVALRPVRLIQETANRIRSDNLGERIPVSDVQDEISSLARLLNEMFDRLEASFQQVRRFSAEASHELKTPLSLMRLQAEKLLSDGRLGPVQEDAVQEQLVEISRMNHIIEDLLFLSRAEARSIHPDLRREDPRTFLRNLSQDAALLAEQAGVSYQPTIDAAGEVSFDAKLMRQVLLNLISNALRFSPPGGLLTLHSEFTLEAWRLTLEDEGPGVPAGQRETIFERFVRLGDSEDGSGLGLTICRSILALHGGTIRADEGPRKGGLRVTCEIPLATPPTAPAASRETSRHEHVD